MHASRYTEQHAKSSTETARIVAHQHGWRFDGDGDGAVAEARGPRIAWTIEDAARAREQIIDELLRWPYKASDELAGPWGDLLVTVPGSFDDVVDAVRHGLLPGDIHDEILRRYTAVDTARCRRSIHPSSRPSGTT